MGNKKKKKPGGRLSSFDSVSSMGSEDLAPDSPRSFLSANPSSPARGLPQAQSVGRGPVSNFGETYHANCCNNLTARLKLTQETSSAQFVVYEYLKSVLEMNFLAMSVHALGYFATPGLTSPDDPVHLTMIIPPDQIWESGGVDSVMGVIFTFLSMRSSQNKESAFVSPSTKQNYDIEVESVEFKKKARNSNIPKITLNVNGFKIVLTVNSVWEIGKSLFFDMVFNQDPMISKCILLVHSWIKYESQRYCGVSLGNGDNYSSETINPNISNLLSLESVQVMCLAVFAESENPISSPFMFLKLFFNFFTNFDWTKNMLTIYGAIPIEELRNPLLSLKSRNAYATTIYSVERKLEGFAEGIGTDLKWATTLYMNIQSVLHKENNLGANVDSYGLAMITEVLSLAAEHLDMLTVYSDNLEKMNAIGEQDDAWDPENIHLYTPWNLSFQHPWCWPRESIYYRESVMNVIRLAEGLEEFNDASDLKSIASANFEDDTIYHSCAQCKKKFVSKNGLTNHFESKHWFQNSFFPILTHHTQFGYLDASTKHNEFKYQKDVIFATDQKIFTSPSVTPKGSVRTLSIPPIQINSYTDDDTDSVSSDVSDLSLPQQQMRNPNSSPINNSKGKPRNKLTHSVSGSSISCSNSNRRKKLIDLKSASNACRLAGFPLAIKSRGNRKKGGRKRNGGSDGGSSMGSETSDVSSLNSLDGFGDALNINLNETPPSSPKSVPDKVRLRASSESEEGLQKVTNGVRDDGSGNMRDRAESIEEMEKRGDRRGSDPLTIKSWAKIVDMSEDPKLGAKPKDKPKDKHIKAKEVSLKLNGVRIRARQIDQSYIKVASTDSRVRKDVETKHWQPTKKFMWIFCFNDENYNIYFSHGHLTGRKMLSVNGEIVHTSSALLDVTKNITFVLGTFDMHLRIISGLAGGFTYELYLSEAKDPIFCM